MNNYNKAKEEGIELFNEKFDECVPYKTGTTNAWDKKEKNCSHDLTGYMQKAKKALKSFLSTFADTIQRADREDAADSIDIILTGFDAENRTAGELLDEIIKWRKALLQKGEE